MPDDWRAAYITPVYKKDAKSNVSNYRPTSLTSQLCKILEDIVRDAVFDHVEEQCLVKDIQHGSLIKSCGVLMIMDLHGIGGKVWSWVRALLSDRWQQVHINV